MNENTAELKSIETILEHYINGAKTGLSKDMRPAFHKDATIFGYVGDDLFAGSIELLFSWNEENGSAEDLVYEIGHVEIEGTIATARIELNNWHGRRFTDLFTLLKHDGEWKIISKVFLLHAE
jgi:hypothetical protein|tara:strand:+ start:310 stop:678 length:369 start_codon:yes stop_codon:yes gene_type:complete